MIPEAAVEAAVSEVDRVLSGELVGGAADTLVRAILEAASPHIHRTAWNEGFTAARAMQDFRDTL